jgi:hypothetical protein
MPRAPKSIKRPFHRPLLEIDWSLVDDYLETGCPGTKIADAIGVCADTLYDRCEREKGVSFSAYSQTKKNKGDALLFKAQFDKAIGRTDLGDSSLLTHLGKTRLEQREAAIVTASPEQEKNYRQVIDQLAELQAARQNSSSLKEEGANEPTND